MIRTSFEQKKNQTNKQTNGKTNKKLQQVRNSKSWVSGSLGQHWSEKMGLALRVAQVSNECLPLPGSLKCYQDSPDLVLKYYTIYNAAEMSMKLCA